MMCALCLTQTHKLHTFRPIEEEFDSQKNNLETHLKTLRGTLDLINRQLSERNETSILFKESVGLIRQIVDKQIVKLRENLDSISDSIMIELSSRLEEERKSHYEDRNDYERCAKEIKQLIFDDEQIEGNTSIASLFELTARLATVPSFDDPTTKCVPHAPPLFLTGKINLKQMKTMIGYLQADNLSNEGIEYERRDAGRQKSVEISNFRVPQDNQISSICPINDNSSWISVFGSTALIQVDKKGDVKENVKLDFKPRCVAMTRSKELLITHQGDSSLIHKLSWERQVSRFADISPLRAWGLSISVTEEVYVSTGTPTIVVLDSSGDMLQQLACGEDGWNIACLTADIVAITTGHINLSEKLTFLNNLDQIIYTWSGNVDTGDKVEETCQCSIACDEYDNVFVPDYNTNQVYVIPGNEGKAKCLLDKKHGVKLPTAVGVDECGHVWIGCKDGKVHVMQL